MPGPKSVLGSHRLVAYYGNPRAAALGVLGEGTPRQMLERLRHQAIAYEADRRPVQPALHLIAALAAAEAGADGMYRIRMPFDLLEEWSAIAAEQGLLLILDLQIGRSTVEEEVTALRPFLAQPHIHLALDPEWAIGAAGLPRQQVGSLDAASINWAIDYCADLSDTYGLANRVLLVHQFRASMIRGKSEIRMNPRVDLAIIMDGFGAPDRKVSKYRRFASDSPTAYAGIKLFYRHDVPMMAPLDALALRPPPDVVIYQ